MQEKILSAGIDIGTSTTQLIFSRLTIENLANSYSVPRISIVDKEVIYRSGIYFTPLASPSAIDAAGVENIVRREYGKAGLKPEDIRTGAVIITGETARKENAGNVLEALSEMAGDFVVATAGPDLESVLSARGAGTDILSRKHGMTVANVDIGGGTSNIAVFSSGELTGVCCLDIGGRLIKVDRGRITYIYHKIQKLCGKRGIDINVGDRADIDILRRVCGIMADQIAMALHLMEPDAMHGQMYTNDGKTLNLQHKIQGLTFSGGVADCMADFIEKNLERKFDKESGKHENADVFKFGDIGILLGEAIRENPYLCSPEQFKAAETIRATVVGAGMHTTDVSGSTISYAGKLLPLKNIPVLKINENADTLSKLENSIRKKLDMIYGGRPEEPVALCFHGKSFGSFDRIQMLADSIITGGEAIINSPQPLVVVFEHDIAKVLGNALKARIGCDADLICIDGIHAADGDYLDIGEPLSQGNVLPVVIKTLVFNS